MSLPSQPAPHSCPRSPIRAIRAWRWTSTGLRRCRRTPRPSNGARPRCRGGGRSRRTGRRPGCCKAITLIDLTTLSGDDTAGRVQRLCAKARQPVRAEMLETLGHAGPDHRARSASITTWSKPPFARWRARASPSPPSPPAFPAGLSPLPPAHRRDRRKREGGRARDRHRDFAPPCADAELAGALRRNARDARGLRRRPHEGDPRHG